MYSKFLALILVMGIFSVFGFGETIVSAQTADAQAVQQSVITWNAFVEQPLVPPATVLPQGQQFAAYVINRGIGAAVCNAVASQLPTTVMTIAKISPPGITPTSWTDTGYPDANGIVCWEVYVKFADGTFSLRSKRLIKEIISTKNSVANVAVQ